MLASFETAYLERTNQLIRQRLSPLAHDDDAMACAEHDLLLASSYLCVSDQSKRVRPLLCLYFRSLFGDAISDDFHNLGVAAEFIHGASLLHDDIVDEADQRRGKNSVNRQFGNARAVLAGDFLLTEAFDLLRTFERTLIDNAIVVVRQMTRAAMTELNARGKWDITPSSLRSISYGKTGCLFAWCGFAAAHYAEQAEAAATLWTVGERIGFVFQLADDIKDFHGDNELKDVCRDIRNRELSLPILLACDEDAALREDLRRAFLAESMSLDDAVHFKSRVLATSGIARATTVMTAELDLIISSLLPWQKSAGFLRLTEFVQHLCSVTPR